jgi:hypothetical protein
MRLFHCGNILIGNITNKLQNARKTEKILQHAENDKDNITRMLFCVLKISRILHLIFNFVNTHHKSQQYS